MTRPATHTAIKIPAGNYTAIIKPRVTRSSSRSQPGVVLVLKPPSVDDSDQIFTFASWKFLRDHLRLFGFATAEELDNADVRLTTGRQPYMFSSRRWEAPLIEALDLTCAEP
ncbi:MAG TPA: hypothetical protein VGG26_05305 [Terracidiphilus sp.]|jgi:hypothetical protein